MNSTEFYELVAAKFECLCHKYALQMPKEKSFIIRLDGPEVFVGIAYDAHRSREVLMHLGLQKGLTHPVERPLELAELLRIVGHYELPEVEDEVVAATDTEVGGALSRLAELLSTYGHDALRGDRAFFARLDKQRDLDCYRYTYDRPLDNASRAACVAWSKGQCEAAVSLLRPFQERLTASERSMLEEAEERSKER